MSVKKRTIKRSSYRQRRRTGGHPEGSTKRDTSSSSFFTAHYLFTFLHQIEKNIYLRIPPGMRATMGERMWQSLVLGKKIQVQARSRIMELGKGMTISYLEIEAPESAPLLLFLHGFGDIKENFLLSASLLRRHFHVVIPDLPGFGESFRNIRIKYSLSQYRDWVIRFMKKFPGRRIHLMGNSMGGAIAAEVALKAPSLVSGLVLVNSAGILLEESLLFYREVMSAQSPFMINDLEGLNRLLDRIFFTRPYVPLFILDYVANRFESESKWYQKIIHDLAYPDKEKVTAIEGILKDSLKWPQLMELGLNHKVGQIKTPTLIIWGNKDQFFPLAVGEYFHREIKDSILKVLPNVGHSPQIESPLVTTRMVTQFIYQLERSEKGEGTFAEQEEEMAILSPWSYLFGSF